MKTITRLMHLDSKNVKSFFRVTEVITAVSFFFVKNMQATFTFSDIATFIAVQIFEILLFLCQSYVHQSYSCTFLINGNEKNSNVFPCNIIFEGKKPCSCFSSKV